MSQTIDAVYRDFNTAGVPASGDHQPRKPEIRALLKQIQNAGGQAVTRNTLTALQAVTPPNENYMGVVLTGAGAGYYSRVAGAWVFGRPFADAFAKVVLSGTGTAQSGVVSPGVTPSSIEVFFAKVVTPNTGALTLSIGGTARQVVNLAGNPLSPGEWTGTVMFYLNDANQYQLLIDAGAAASAAASASEAEVERIAAEAAAEAALSAVSGIVAPKATVALAMADNPAVDPAYYDVAYFDTAYQTGSGSKYRKRASEPSHPGKFQNANRVWYEIDAPTLQPEMFGETGTANDYTVFAAWAATTVALVRPWHIAPGTYLVDGAEEMVLKTSGVCEGIIEIPKTNHECRFVFMRDDTGPAFNGGIILSTASWDSLSYGKTDISAFNAAGKNLYIRSTETLIERDGSGGTPYFKQEFIRVPSSNGHVSSGLVCTYDSLANLTVTSYVPSLPITVEGLHVRRTGVTGGAETFRGLIVVWRDNVTLNSPQISNDDPQDPISVGIEVSYCADVVINEPDIRGLFYEGLGYGIIFGQTIGCVINGGNILDCRHSVTGRHNVDLHINGGNHSYVIDDHWGDRMVIKDVTQHCLPGYGAIEYAGNNITIENHNLFGGRSLLGIRADTPHLGGKVVIKNPKVDSREPAGFFYLFGFSSPNGPNPSASWTTTPTLPDTVIMEDVEIQSATAYSYCAHLGGTFNSVHTNWGDIILRGACRFNGVMFGIYLVKNSTYQRNRTTTLLVDGPMDFNGGQAIYADAADNVATRAVEARIVGIKNGDIRIRPNAVLTLNVDRSVIGRIDKDGAEAAGSSLFIIRNSRMIGGVVTASFRNIAFLGCTFTGNYTAFPAQADVTMDGNIRLGVTGLPANIRGAAVSPFA